MLDLLLLCVGFDDISVTVGGAYATGGYSPSLDCPLCGLGTGGAGLCGTMFDDVAPGGFGAGRSGTMLPFVGMIGDAYPGAPLGTGGGALGFSKLSPSFLGNRGLAGGLII